MTRFELVTSSLPRKRSTPELHRHSWAGDEVRTRDIQLGRLTLYQLSYSRLKPLTPLWGEQDSNLRRYEPTDLQSVLVGRLSISPTITSRWRDSNPRPADYKSAALANWATSAYVGNNKKRTPPSFSDCKGIRFFRFEKIFTFFFNPTGDQSLNPYFCTDLWNVCCYVLAPMLLPINGWFVIVIAW